SQIVLKLRGARNRKRAATGRCEGRKPYGTREGEQAVIARMRELRQAGQGFDKIATTLNNEGIKPRVGERFYGSVVNRILTGKRCSGISPSSRCRTRCSRCTPGPHAASSAQAGCSIPLTVCRPGIGYGLELIAHWAEDFALGPGGRS